MKEFLFGGLVSIWFILLGLSAINVTFTIISIIYPVVLGLIIVNYIMMRKIFGISKRRLALAHK